MYHYVYRITNFKLNKHYYGKRSSKIPPELDIGKKYFSSSKDKAFILDQKENPQNYVYVVLSTFETSSDALDFEITLHSLFNVGVNDRFYNLVKQTNLKFDASGKKYRLGGKLSDEAKLKISIKNKGKTRTDEHKNKVSAANLGRPFTKEHRQKISESNRRRKLSMESRLKISIKNSGANSPNAIPVDIFDYVTNEKIASNVIIKQWCKLNNYDSSSLSKTVNANHNKPHNSNYRNKETYNYRHHKGIYAVKVKS